MRIAKRKARLVTLFSDGLTVRQASAQLKREGFTKGSGRSVVGQTLQQLAREAPECIEDARLEVLNQLRALNQAIASAEQLGLKDQVSLLLQILDRHTRLLGLDSPQKSLTANLTPPAPLGVVKMDFSKKVVKTPDLVSEQEYLDNAEEQKLLMEAGIENN